MADFNPNTCVSMKKATDAEARKVKPSTDARKSRFNNLLVIIATKYYTLVREVSESFTHTVILQYGDLQCGNVIRTSVRFN